MALEKFTFLDEVGIQKLSEALLGKVNSRISERIVQELTDASDANHVASATLLNSLLKTRDALIAANSTGAATNKTEIGKVVSDISDLTTKVGENTSGVAKVGSDITALDEKVTGLTHLTIDLVVGPIDDVVDPKTDVLYLQKDDESDTTWMLYIYRADSTWVSIGDTAVDLSNYWSKDDVTEIKESIGVPEVTPMAVDSIAAAVEKAFANTPAFVNKFTVTVSNSYLDDGNGSGQYLPGDEVTVHASPLSASEKSTMFVKWKVISGGVTIVNDDSNPIDPTGRFIMPSGNVEVAAVYEEDIVHKLTVVGTENDDGEYMMHFNENKVVKHGSKSGYVFKKWTTTSGYAFEHSKDTDTTFNMRDGDAILTAEWYALDELLEIGSGGNVNATNVLRNMTADNKVDIVIPDSATYMITQAFSDCPALRSIVIPEGFTSLSNGAFSNCPSLTNVTLPSSLTTINPSSFYNTGLKSINIPSNVTGISPSAFENCAALTTININKPKDSIEDAPWGATNATVNWLS